MSGARLRNWVCSIFARSLISECCWLRVKRQRLCAVPSWILIATINEKTGGGTKYINRRDVNYIPAAITEENYRKNLTSAMSQCVAGHKTYKYSQVTDYIYKAVFKENAKEYRNVLSLDSKDNVRHTLYAEVLLVISSFENGVGATIQQRFKENGGRLLSMEEVKAINFSNKKPFSRSPFMPME